MKPLIGFKKATPLFFIAFLTVCPELSPKPQSVVPAAGYSRFNTAKQQNGVFTPAGGNWNIVPSPNTGSPHNYFYGVAAIATNDAWAVGGYGNLTTQAQQLVQHWNGQNWAIATPACQSLGEGGFFNLCALTGPFLFLVGAFLALLDLGIKQRDMRPPAIQGTEQKDARPAGLGTLSIVRAPMATAV